MKGEKNDAHQERMKKSHLNWAEKVEKSGGRLAHAGYTYWMRHLGKSVSVP